MDTPQPDADVVAAALAKTLHDLYGGAEVVAIIMWCPPGNTKMDLYSNGDPPKVVKALRQASQAAELTQLKWEETFRKR